MKEGFEARGIIKMDAAEFIAMPNHPAQRDTEYRAMAARRGHLKAPSVLHQSVAVAEMPDGRRYKLDGHTRAFLWENGFLPVPTELLQATVFYCHTTEALLRLYGAFDNAGAAKGPRDQVQSAYRLVGIRPLSPIFKTGGGIKSTLAHAEGFAHGTGEPVKSLDVVEAVDRWRAEIMALDTIGFAKSAFPSPYVCAALLIVNRDGPGALPFFQKMQVKAGRADGQVMDPVFTAVSYLKHADYVKVQKADSLTPVQRHATVAAVLLNAYSGWLAEPEGTFTKYPAALKVISTFNPFLKVRAAQARGETAAIEQPATVDVPVI